MHSLRRAALRAAVKSRPSLAVASSQQPLASLAVQIGKPSILPAASSLSIARFFSQSLRLATEATNEIDSTPQPDSTSAARASESNPTTPAEGRRAAVFVSNMTFDATEEHLKEAFTKFGEVLSVSIGRDGRGLSRGFGFVTYKDAASVDQAVSEANGSFWHGRRINVQRRKDDMPPARRPPRSEPSSSIYIGNIPYETSDADLNKLFTELENVTDVRVAVDRNTGWPRGFAHADFTDVESAIKAYEKLRDMELGSRKLRVDYSQSFKAKQE